MSWRHFTALVSGLSGESVYRHLASGGGKPRPLTAKDAPAFFASFRKAG
jgi:hypothetical protein